MTTYKGDPLAILYDADDVTDKVLRDAEETVDWFDDEPSMPTTDFIDRMCQGGGYLADGTPYDIEELDSPAVRKIMRHARQVRRDRTT